MERNRSSCRIRASASHEGSPSSASPSLARTRRTLDMSALFSIIAATTAGSLGNSASRFLTMTAGPLDNLSWPCVCCRPTPARPHRGLVCNRVDFLEDLAGASSVCRTVARLSTARKRRKTASCRTLGFSANLASSASWKRAIGSQSGPPIPASASRSCVRQRR